eukprot:g63900.t1
MRGSRRASETIASPIVAAGLLAKGPWKGEGPVLSLGQGMVYWDPPVSALQRLALALPNSTIHRYGPVSGQAALLDALRRKLRKVNQLDLTGMEVMVTAGSNQGFLATMLAIADPGDEVILFIPYYFNHLMALTLLNLSPVLVHTLPNGQLPPVSGWPFTARTKAVVIVSPCNPTGQVVPASAMKAAQEECRARGIWLIRDEAYEQFYWTAAEGESSSGEVVGPSAVTGDNVVLLYTFSKGYAMAGWRIGYVVFPTVLTAAYAKIQDTIPIHIAQASQQLALEILSLPDFGREWMKGPLRSLRQSRQAVWDAIKKHSRQAVWDAIKKHVSANPSPHPPAGGAIYFWVPLPRECTGFVTDEEAVTFLVKEWGVSVLPGGSFGDPSGIRVSFGNLQPELCREASRRLGSGLDTLKAKCATPWFAGGWG